MLQPVYLYWFLTKSLIPVFKLKESLSARSDVKELESVPKALLGLQGFTGCDTVSAFSGKEKSKTFELILKNESYINIFVEIVKALDISEVTSNILENFVGEMYGHKGERINHESFISHNITATCSYKKTPPCSDV